MKQKIKWRYVLGITLCFLLIGGMMVLPVHAHAYTDEQDVDYNVGSSQKPLGVPENFRMGKTPDGRIVLAWSYVKNASIYAIYCSPYANIGYKRIGVTQNYYFRDLNAKTPGSYYYRVVALAKHGDTYRRGQYSKALGLLVRPGSTSIWGDGYKGKATLRWKKVSGAQFYVVYRRSTNGSYQKIAETAHPYYVDSGVDTNQTYLYRVAAAFRWNGKAITGEYSPAYKVEVISVDPNGKMIALTYDDGPCAYTKEIVDCLKAHDARATFFVVGNSVSAYPDAARSIVASGSEIGNHTLTHANLANLSNGNIRHQIDSTNQIVFQTTGKVPSMVRPPWGSITSRVQSNVGMPIILWSVDTQDWLYRSKRRTVSYVLNNARDGDIVLMHDIHRSTKEATLELVGKLQAKGYQLVTVSELAKYKGYNLQNGKVYYEFVAQ